MKIRWAATWGGSQKSLLGFHTQQTSNINLRTKLIPTSPRFAHVRSTIPNDLEENSNARNAKKSYAPRCALNIFEKLITNNP